MKIRKIVHKDFLENTDFLNDCIQNFQSKGTPFGNQKRNSLKLFDLDDLTLNIKSFKVPNIINQYVYRFFRKSKAQRSYEYANKLLALGIDTPKPIAYYEQLSLLSFKKSFYISEHLNCKYTYRDLTKNFEIENYDAILRAFTRFTYKLHEKGIHFLDHSPGNTLISVKDNDYNFYLVDLNRMEFKVLDFKTRMKNFSRLTKHKFMVEIMSSEYAKCSGLDYTTVFSLMWEETEAFKTKALKKKQLKKKLRFWKK